MIVLVVKSCKVHTPNVISILVAERIKVFVEGARAVPTVEGDSDRSERGDTGEEETSV